MLAGVVVAGGQVGGGGEGGAGMAVEDREELRAAEHVAGRGAVVGGGIADDVPETIDRAVGGFAGDFGATVAVEIVDHELRVVRSGADVPPKVDPPEARAVQLVGIEENVAGVTALRVVLRVRGIPL